MIQVIKTRLSKARKTYNDDAWEYIQQWIDNGCPVLPTEPPLSFAEKRELVKYRNGQAIPHKILYGQLYEYQFNKFEGETYAWRAKKLFYDLCVRYDLFDEI